jgi:hypothetical protein
VTSFYFAASFDRGAELVELADFVRDFGHEVTSTWLEKSANGYEAQEMSNGRTFEDIMRECCEIDLSDIERASMVVSFTESTRDRYFSGGRHVEFGYAYRSNKSMLVVGPKENIFHHLPGVHCFETIDEFKEWVSTLTTRLPRTEATFDALTYAR